MKARDLKPGQAIRFEFGAPENWITLKIQEVHLFEKMVTLEGKNTGFQQDYSFNLDEEVEVIAG